MSNVSMDGKSDLNKYYIETIINDCRLNIKSYSNIYTLKVNNFLLRTVAVS